MDNETQEALYRQGREDAGLEPAGPTKPTKPIKRKGAFKREDTHNMGSHKKVSRQRLGSFKIPHIKQTRFAETNNVRKFNKNNATVNVSLLPSNKQKSKATQNGGYKKKSKAKQNGGYKKKTLKKNKK
jgi:hypothetical protein